MFIITVNGTVAALIADAKRHAKALDRAAISSVNKVAELARTDGARKLAAAKHVPYSATRKRAPIRKARKGKPYATIVSLQQGIPIDKLKARKMKRGYSAAKQKFPHSFQMTQIIAERVERNGVRAKRLPIERTKIELRPEAEPIYAGAVAKAHRQMDRIFQQQVKRYLG